MLNRLRHDAWKLWIALLCCAVAGGLVAERASAAEVLMKDGRVLRGMLGEVSGLADIPAILDTNGDTGRMRSIVFLDDSLTRTFVSQRQIQEVHPDAAGQVLEKFRINQQAAHSGSMVRTVGPITKIEPFDQYGRRIITMNTVRGPVHIIQGITEITPEWTKVEGIKLEKMPCVWDMRIATSSIPSETLHKILIRQTGKNSIEQRKKLAKFFLQCERFREAGAELKAILDDFPDDTALKEQLAPSIKAIRQLTAKSQVRELKRRRDAGQHELVLTMLKKFPPDDVEGETLQEVREMIQDYEALEQRRAKAVALINELTAKTKDAATRQAIEPLRKEIAAELSFDTLDRVAAFLQNADDPKMPAEEKLALAISGWLLGPDAAAPELPLAMSVIRMRALAVRYLTESIKLNRVRLFHDLPSEAGADAARLAAILAHMKPPYDLPEPVSEQTPGYFDMEAAVLPKESPVHYSIQLPPEYNPYRRYPMIVTLRGAGTTNDQQIDWWAGAWAHGMRTGQATRHGYIVLAPDWAGEHQDQYHYSAREHAIVLGCYRDACRRFAVDTDRVFLSGHSMGGDAAWDIGLAHPDLWAGVIPISAESARYCNLYWENARNLPFYVICGELDGAKMNKNARDLDRYLRRGFNATVVQYQGRGHEHFSDETLRLFDWMGRFHREFFPREFNCATMREGDNFFWWVELSGMPPRAMVSPSDWPPPRGTEPVHVKANVTANNNLSIQTGTTRLTVWLASGMFDFKRPISIVVNGHKMNNRTSNLSPNLETLLEDVRTRGDRQHPFWARFDCPTGRVAPE